MVIKDKIRRILREVYGDFNTSLEIEYENTITENLLTGTYKDKLEWVTYNQVILEVKHNVKNMLKVKQLQYELTENRNPNEVCINVLNGLNPKTQELERLYYKIKGF
tara:strand:+ start:9367 stop:9687 length:321 start_codon:yes stop_codon:yes gene_type:complete